MRLVRIHIYGFGHLTDVKYEFPEQGITVIYGPNEAGKSTVMECVRCVLFGFESSKSRSRYEPVNSGNFGAKLTFHTDQDMEITTAWMNDSLDDFNNLNNLNNLNNKYDRRIITVERMFSGRSLRGEVKVVTEDNERIGSDEDLQELLQHMSSQVYKSVFAFGLSELEDLHSLSEKDIQARIHSAGMGIKSVSPIELEKRLENKRLALYRKRGQDQPVTKLIREKQDVKKLIQQISDMPRQYNNLQSQYQQLQHQLDELKSTKQKADAHLNSVATHAAVRQIWEETVPLQRVLETFPELPSCPPVTYFEWQEKIAEQQRIVQQTNDIELAVQQLNDAIANIPDNNVWLSIWQEVSELYETRTGMTESIERSKQLEWEANQLEQKLQEAINRIGNRTDPAELQRIRISMVEFETIRKYGETYQQLREQIASLTTQLSKLEQELEQVEHQYEQLTEQLQRTNVNTTLDADTILLQQSELQRMQKLVYEVDSLQARMRDSKQQYEQIKGRQSQLVSSTPGRKQSKSSKWSDNTTHVLLPLVLCVALLAITVWAFRQNGSGNFVIVVVACLLLAIGSVFHSIRLSQNKNRNMYQIERKERSDSDTFLSLLTTFERDMERLLDRLNEIFKELNGSAKAFGITLTSQETHYLSTQLQQLEGRLQKAKENRDAYERIEERLHDVSQQRNRIHSLYSKTMQSADWYGHEKQQWESNWSMWLEEHHLPIELMPDSAFVFLQAVERAQELYQETQSKWKEKARLQEQVERYLHRLAIVLQTTSADRSSYSIDRSAECASDRAIDPTSLNSSLTSMSDSSEQLGTATCNVENESVKLDKWLVYIQSLYDQVQAKRLEAAKRISMEQERQQRMLQKQILLEKQLQLHNEFNEWLQEYGFRESAEVAQSYEITVKRQELEQQLQLLQAKMETKIQSDESYQEVLDRVQEYDLAAWQRKLEDAEQTRLALQNEMEDCKRLQGKLELEIEQFEKTTTHSELLHKMSTLDAELQELAEEWAVYTITQKLLEKARKTYEKERQPAVLKQASEWFQTITEQRYQKVISPFGSDSLEVVTEDQTQLPTASLSRGTAEQLYLTMRFALIDELSEKGIHAPIVMDDVFVNFDSDRLRTTLQVLEEISHRHQILYLTCHPHIVERIRSHTSMFEVVPV